MKIVFPVPSAGLNMAYETNATDLSPLDVAIMSAGLRETVNNYVNTKSNKATESGSPMDTKAKQALAEEVLARIISGEYQFGGGGLRANPRDAAFKQIVTDWLCVVGPMKKKVAVELVKRHGPTNAWLALHLQRKHGYDAASSYDPEAIAGLSDDERDAVLAPVWAAVDKSLAASELPEEVRNLTI